MAFVDPLEKLVSTVKKEVSQYDSNEASLISNIFKSISHPRKTYEILLALDKAGRVRRFVHYYTKYRFESFDTLRQIIERGVDQLLVIEFLVIIHLISIVQNGRRFDFDKYMRPSGNIYSLQLPEPDISDVDFVKDILGDYVDSRRKLTNVEFAETLKIVAGPLKGRDFRFYRAPYQRQIHQWMSPEDDCVDLTNMWGVQIGKSTVLENTCVFYMKEEPSEILAALSTDEAARRFSVDRIEPRAESVGVRFIAENYGYSGKRASGNATNSKQFQGGNYHAITVGSPSKTASSTKRILLKDEIDRWPLTAGSEGSTDLVVDARAETWGQRRKVLNVSSPNLTWTSVINKKYKAGTQHHYYVQCPHCKKKYPMSMGVGMDDGGLTYETKNNRIDLSSVVYKCHNPKCKNVWYESDKLFAMQNGLWVPHKEKPDFPNRISTQLSSLYSPFSSFGDVCIKHYQQDNDPDKEQSFVNMTLGLPYEPKGTRPDVVKLITLRDNGRDSGVIPEGALFITAAVDVQRGSDNPDKKNPPRLELEVKAHHSSYITSSIDYVTILGDTTTLGEGAWKELDELMDTGRFDYLRDREEKLSEVQPWSRVEIASVDENGESSTDFAKLGLAPGVVMKRLPDNKRFPGVRFDIDGVKIVLSFDDAELITSCLVFSPMAWAIDAKDGLRNDVVYSFCRMRGGAKARVFPSMGLSYITNKENKGKSEGYEDRAASGDYYRYRKRKIDSELTVLMISTNHYKKRIYQFLNRTIQKAGISEDFAGKCYFPKDYPDSYFKMLTAEDHRIDGTFYCPKGKRNEALDVFVYNEAVADMWMNMFIESLREQMKIALTSSKQQHRLGEIENIDYTYARDILWKRTNQIVGGVKEFPGGSEEAGAEKSEV